MNKLTHTLVLVLLASAVLFAVPFTDTFMFDSKKLILFIVSLVILGITAAELWKKRSIVFTFSPFCAALSALSLSVLISTFFANPYPYEALFGWGGVLLSTLIVAGLGSEYLAKKDTTTLPVAMSIVGAVLGVLTALQAFGYGPSRLYNLALGTNIPHNALFNLAESPLAALQVLFVVGVGVGALLLTKKERLTQPFYIGTAGLIAVGLVVSLYSVFFNKETKAMNMLPWAVNATVIKSQLMSTPKAALIGMGPEGFAHGYSAFKPASINQTDLWNIEFTNGVNLPMMLTVTLGLFGLASWVLLVFLILKRVYQHRGLLSSPLTWMLLALLLVQVLFPPTIVIVTLFGVVLAYWLASQVDAFEKVKLHTLITRLSPDQAKSASVSITHVLSIGVSALLIAVILASVYGAGRAYAASYFFFKSSEAVVKQKSANEIYELQKQAVKLNPYFDVNRRRYGLTNLAVAQALANKPDLTDEERQQVLQLVQQAIREGRAATVLQPEDARNWEALSAIYQNLVGVATGADQWAVQSVSRAIEADPNNPVLWFSLGSVLSQNQQHAEAARAYAQAVQLKPTYHNALYNLANSLKLDGKTADAVAVYENLLSQLPADSSEYQLVQAELNQVKAAASATNEQSSNTEETSVVESSLTPKDEAVQSQPTDLSQPAQQYLDATPVQQ